MTDLVALLTQALREHVDRLTVTGASIVVSCSCGQWLQSISPTEFLPTGEFTQHRAEAVLAAVEPAIRAKVAEEIRATVDGDCGGACLLERCDCHGSAIAEHAARIAEGVKP